LLTDEETGKGKVSLLDPADKVVKTLEGYQPSGPPTEVSRNQSGGETLYFGDVEYHFENWRLISYDGVGGSFETTKGLKVGDPISKAISLYGKNYSSQDAGGSGPGPSYSFPFKNTTLWMITVGKSKADQSNTIYQIGVSTNADSPGAPAPFDDSGLPATH